MRKEKGKLHIRTVLKERDEGFWESLQRVWKTADPAYESIEKVKGKLDAIPHSLAVEQNLCMLIPDQWKYERLQPIELFALSASACLHDIDKGLNTLKKSHGEVSAGEIRAHFYEYGLDPGQADLVGWIIKVHDHGDFSFDLPSDPIVVGSTEVEVRTLAALFRLADILHADYRRIGEAKPLEPKDRARFCIRGWKYDAEGKIAFQADPEEVSDLEHIYRAIAMMQRDIEKIAPILRNAGYPYKLTIPQIDESKLIYTAKGSRHGKRSFLGMDSFSEDDQHLFKGRRKESQELYQLLLTGDPVIALVGESGIGKTSLIKAGLCPILRKAGWKFAYTRFLNIHPKQTLGCDQVSNLIGSIWLQIMDCESPDDTDFVEAIRKISDQHSDKTNLIIMDQFERAFESGNIPEQIIEFLYAIQAMRFRNIRVLLSYRIDFDGLVGPVLQDVAYSLRSIPKLYLHPLDRAGAEDALSSGFDASRIGFDPDVGAKRFLNIILDDIELDSQYYYPPYIQIVGETLKNHAEDGIIRKPTYDRLNGAKGIIANYLFNQLESFGKNRKYAEMVLVELTKATDSGVTRVRVRSLEELEAELGMELDDLKELLNQMSEKRMIRQVGAECYEIIHDQLAEQVNQKLVIAFRDAEYRQLREHLSTSATTYASTNTLLEVVQMARLYMYRERINPTQVEKEILIHSCLANKGSAWYWFRNSRQQEWFDLIRSGLMRDNVRLYAIHALGGTAVENAVPILTEMLDSPDVMVCSASAEALGRLGFPKAVPALMRLLNDADIFKRVSAAKALSKLGAREVMPHLLNMMEHEELNVKKIAVKAFADMATDEDSAVLRQMLCSNIPAIRGIAIKAMSRLHGQDFMQELRLILKDKSKAVRIASYKALASLSDHENIPELRRMLDSDSVDIRAIAAEGLARLGDRAGLEELAKLLGNSDKNMQIACKALIRLGSIQAMPEVKKMLSHENPAIRSMSARYIGLLGTIDEIPGLLRMIISDHKGRSGAKDALINIDRKLYCPFCWIDDEPTG